MLVALVKYNIDYYIKSVRYLPPCLIFVVFLALNYQTSPIGIWSNLHITSLAIFILANWLSASLVNSEDKTQQYITRLHANNDTVFHLSKPVSVITLLIPFYVLTLLIPLIAGSFPRNLHVSEIFVYLAAYFLIGFLGVSVGIFFNSNIFTGESAIMLHLIVTGVLVIPFNVIFDNILPVVYAYYFLPPINFTADRLHSLGDDRFSADWTFLIFAVWALSYAIMLTALYIFVMRRRNKE
ncbi:MAG: hypothetical protein FWC70_04530 [Defluviitaleaceae bacterium]|nr:hypothetical protein [Defluviitaleaceae bacterium]